MIKKVLNFIHSYWVSITTSFAIIIIIGSLSLIHVSFGSHDSDKLFHITSYIALSFPAALRASYNYVSILICFVLFGSVIEVLQAYFNRNFELYDILANTLGTFLGIFFADLIKKYYSY